MDSAPFVQVSCLGTGGCETSRHPLREEQEIQECCQETFEHELLASVISAVTYKSVLSTIYIVLAMLTKGGGSCPQEKHETKQYKTPSERFQNFLHNFFLHVQILLIL